MILIKKNSNNLVTDFNWERLARMAGMSAVMGDGKDKKGANDEPEPPGEATPAKKSKPNPAPPPAEVARGNHTNPNLQVNCNSI